LDVSYDHQHYPCVTAGNMGFAGGWVNVLNIGGEFWHRGCYHGGQPKLSIYCLFGGLSNPSWSTSPSMLTLTLPGVPALPPHHLPLPLPAKMLLHSPHVDLLSILPWKLERRVRVVVVRTLACQTESMVALPDSTPASRFPILISSLVWRKSQGSRRR